jgi:hypothetical protein
MFPELQSDITVTPDDVRKMIAGPDANMLDAVKKLADLLKNAEFTNVFGLSEWERDFIRDISGRGTKSLSAKQRGVFNKIFNLDDPTNTRRKLVGVTAMIAALAEIYTDEMKTTAKSAAEAREDVREELKERQMQAFYAEDDLFGMF